MCKTGLGPKGPASAEPLHVTIRGVTYDLTEFAPKHPGGSVLQFYSGLDATDAYNAFHYNKKPAKYLKNLPVVPLQTPAPTGKEASLLSDFRALHESWEARGFFKPTLAFWVPWCVAVLGAVLAGARLGGVAGGLLLGVAWAHCGFVQHHAGHMGMIRTQILFECLVKGGSARWWRNRHTKHHACPNVLGKDGDLRTTPFLAWDGVLARKVPSPLLRVQHVAFLPLLIAYVPIFFLTTKKYLLHAASSLKLEIACVAAHWAIALWALPLRQLAVLYGVGYAVQGVYLGFFFALSHYHLPRQSDQQPWPQLQAAASADWGQGSAAARLISGFLNLQIEHHFAPRLSPEYMGTIAPEVKALCEKHGIAYQTSDFWTAAGHTFGGLRSTAIVELARRNSKPKAA